MRKHEFQLQRSCIEWHRIQYPSQLVFHIPNSIKFIGNNRGAFFAEISRLKSIGLIKGIPDLFLALPRGAWHGLFIELKTGNNNATTDQSEIHERLLSAGYLVRCCRTFNEYTATISHYLLS